MNDEPNYNPRSLQEMTSYKIHAKFADINKLHTPKHIKHILVNEYKNKLLCDETFIVDGKEKNFYYGKI